MIWNLPMEIIGAEMLSQQIRLETIPKLGMQIKGISLLNKADWQILWMVQRRLKLSK